MPNFLKKNKKKSNNESDILIKTASLLIHAAKIDENYNDYEKEIIKKTIINLGAKKNDIANLLDKAEKYESSSSQILDFTKEIKNQDEKFKKKNNRVSLEYYIFRF